MATFPTRVGACGDLPPDITDIPLPPTKPPEADSLTTFVMPNLQGLAGCHGDRWGPRGGAGRPKWRG